MGIFTRFRDIVNSNLNAMLEHAEDPEKMIRLMIQEMEETLIEIKMSCAGAIAARKNASRSLDEFHRQTDGWESKARLAMDKGREDLAREALIEKRKAQKNLEAGTKELGELEGIVTKYQEDIAQLEERLRAAREKQRVLVQRHIHAHQKTKAQEQIRRAEAQAAIARFDAFEQRVDRMEASADLVNYGRKPTLEERFAEMERQEEIEKELEALRARVAATNK